MNKASIWFTSWSLIFDTSVFVLPQDTCLFTCKADIYSRFVSILFILLLQTYVSCMINYILSWNCKQYGLKQPYV